MTEVLATATTAFAAAGPTLAALVLLMTRSSGTALLVLLDLLLVAGLVGLSATGTWTTIAAVGFVAALRTLAVDRVQRPTASTGSAGHLC